MSPSERSSLLLLRQSFHTPNSSSQATTGSMKRRTMVGTTLPPSPTASVCDSLADIDDLDAFLAAQGPLTRWTTPPLKDKPRVTVEVAELSEPEGEDYDDDAERDDYERIAYEFALPLSHTGSEHVESAMLIQDILSMARLPPDLLGLTYSILVAYCIRQQPMNLAARTAVPTSLLLVSAMTLADVYTADGPMHAAWWASRILNDKFSAHDVERSMLHMLAALDWSIHCLCSPEALEAALRMLALADARPIPVAAQPLLPSSATTLTCDTKKSRPPRIDVDGSMAVRWEHGQITPADTPTSTVGDELEHRLSQLL
ncbi:hypothetical protein BAUCODRAFT_24217 [Baudoinia panamericana UAMH 10762]|uniref:Uncharacterized protein n=1 Tax=Baudoinia panamericana (strain UAMH 10762) TaxID=717646 RepID=M2MXY7_BAUPA|nr:uncharacterized protein BAUCODRAFT_24217 [Baudoinia panamericana UAMH 10762]EMC96438.1 hypothetical protein BAUCODRAFT_24217 [Baudoinia panamericana UAMH 10762]